MNIESSLSRILRSKMADQVEIFMEESQGTAFTINNNRIDTRNRIKTSGVGIRVIKKGRVGFSYTNNLDKGAIENALKKAVKNSKFSELKMSTFTPLKVITKARGIYDKELSCMDPEKALEEVKKAIKVVRSKNYNLSEGMLSYANSKKTYLNSQGARYEEEGTLSTGYVVTNYKDTTKLWSDSSHGLVDMKHIANESANLVSRSLKKEKVLPGEHTIVIEPEALYQLLSYTLIPAINGERVYRTESALHDKLGEILFPGLDLVDDHIKPGGLYTSAFDREGTPSQKTPVVKKGQLSGFLYDTKTSALVDKKSTGNARGDYSTVPFIGPSNLILRCKKTTDYDFITINRLGGAHTADPVSGAFALNITTGFTPEGFAIKHAVITGDIYHTLKNIIGAHGSPKQVDNIDASSLVIASQKIVA